jgi:hypothetical protein
MFAILRGPKERRHEVDFNEDPVIVDVSIGATTIQITMTAGDPGDPVKGRYVTVALPRDALTAAMATQPLAATSMHRVDDWKRPSAARNPAQAFT